jgi:hypothetical protein
MLWAIFVLLITGVVLIILAGTGVIFGQRVGYFSYHGFATRFTRARGEHGFKMVGTSQAIGLGGMYQRPAMELYVDNNGRQWQTNFVKMEEELERDAEGNVIRLFTCPRRSKNRASVFSGP